jgi:hypothetical protein
MRSLKLPNLLGIWVVLLAALPLLAGPFVVPTDGPVGFRRDRLPLDVDTMGSLSQQLGLLAQGLGGETPVNRRTAAQMLALALVLQPGNPEPRGILEKFSKDDPKPAGDAARLAVARARIWQILAWLELAEAGPDAQALAACLGDVLAIADPKHPRAEERRKNGERGAWAGWVEPLAAFNKSQPLVKNGQPGKSTVPVPVQEPQPDNPIKLAAAVVTTPLWSYDVTTQTHVLRPVPVQMRAFIPEGEAKWAPLTCFLENSVKTEAFKLSSAALVEALEKEHGSVPSGVAVGLACAGKADYLIERNHNSIAGAATVLLNAAITGCEPNATIIGVVQADGSFKLPPRFWEKLRALAGGHGGRLVLPKAAEAYLPSILALEDPEFFFKYEVLLAANLTELIAYSAKISGAELAQATASFIEIRSKLGTQPVPQYVANNFVRQRLEDLVRAAPFHASARMLAIQGAGKRPSVLPRNVLACELREAIRPMAWIANHAIDSPLAQPLQAKPLNDTFEACLREVDRLEPYVELRDRALRAEVRELVITIRTLSRAARGRVDPITKKVPYRREFDALVRDYQAVSQKLEQTAADG